MYLQDEGLDVTHLNNADSGATNTHLTNAYLPVLTAAPSPLRPSELTSKPRVIVVFAKKCSCRGTLPTISPHSFHSAAPLTHFSIYSYHRSICYLQLTVPLTCTDMRFILFIDIVLIIYIATLYEVDLFIFLVGSNVPLLSVSYDPNLSLQHIHRWRTRRECEDGNVLQGAFAFQRFIWFLESNRGGKIWKTNSIPFRCIYPPQTESPHIWTSLILGVNRADMSQNETFSSLLIVIDPRRKLHMQTIGSFTGNLQTATVKQLKPSASGQSGLDRHEGRQKGQSWD